MLISFRKLKNLKLHFSFVMRKYLLPVCILLSCSFSANAQVTDEVAWHKADSAKKELKTAKREKRVDCLNLLSECYLWIYEDDIKQLDSAIMFAKKAYSEANKINYKTGVGYALANIANCAIGKPDEYNAAEAALKMANELKNDYIAGLVYFYLAWNEKWFGTNDKFKTNTQKAISYFENIKGSEFTGGYTPLMILNCPGCKGTEALLDHLHQDLATAYFREFDYKTSEQEYQIAMEYSHKTGNMRMELEALIQMCKIFEIPGDFENGIDFYKKSISLVEKFPADKHMSASGQPFFWMCRLYEIAGDYEDALDIIRKGHDYYPSPIDSFSKALWTSQIGDVHRLMKNYDSALYYLEPFNKTVNSINNLGKVSLGYLYIDLKEYDKALQLITPFVQYLNSIRENRMIFPITNCLLITANAYLGKKDYKSALQYAREGLADLTLMKGRVLMINNYKLLSDIFQAMGKSDSAYFYLKQYTVLKDSLLNRQFYFKLNATKKEAELEKKTSQINLLNKDNQLKEQKLNQQVTVRNSLIGGLMLVFLVALFFFRSLSLKRKKEWAELQAKAKDLEMQALRAQMNPHFIFNCLSSINKFILKNDTDTASDYLTRFSRLIRHVLTNSQLSLIPLSDEVEMLRLYLDMERLRFSESFNYNISYENKIEPK